MLSPTGVNRDKQSNAIQNVTYAPVSPGCCNESYREREDQKYKIMSPRRDAAGNHG